MLPSADKQVELDNKAKEAEIENNIDEEWREFLSDSDKITNREFFDNPIEKFAARTDVNTIVYGTLIENRLDTDDQCLVYLCIEEGKYNIVYVWAGRSQHQRTTLREIHRNFGDWRVTSIHVLGADADGIAMRICSDVDVFSQYFGFEYYPPGSYWD